MRHISDRPPQYEAIADALRTRIAEGSLAPGERLPTRAELREQYGVAGATAQRALEALRREGLVESRPGAGAYVRERPRIARIVRTAAPPAGVGSPWRADRAALGREGAWRHESAPSTAPPGIAERLHIPVGDRVMRTHYVFTDDGAPAYLSTSWEPYAVTQGTPVMLPEAGPYAGAGVRERMAAIGHPPTCCVEEVHARALTVAEARQLGLEAGTIAVIVERTYLDGELPLETADIVFPPPFRAVYQIPVG